MGTLSGATRGRGTSNWCAGALATRGEVATSTVASGATGVAAQAGATPVRAEPVVAFPGAGHRGTSSFRVCSVGHHAYSGARDACTREKASPLDGTVHEATTAFIPLIGGVGVAASANPTRASAIPADGPGSEPPIPYSTVNRIRSRASPPMASPCFIAAEESDAVTEEAAPTSAARPVAGIAAAALRGRSVAACPSSAACAASSGATPTAVAGPTTARAAGRTASVAPTGPGTGAGATVTGTGRSTVT